MIKIYLECLIHKLLKKCNYNEILKLKFVIFIIN